MTQKKIMDDGGVNKRYVDAVAELAVRIATALHPGDPDAIARYALGLVTCGNLGCLAGPDYPRELETADEAYDDLMRNEL